MPSRSRSSHVSKTPSERSAYHRYIGQLESQPTIAEPTGIDPSFEAREELTEPTSRRERRIPLGTRLRDHIEKNWITWVFGVLITIAIFLLFDARVSIAILTHDLSNQQQELDGISASLDKNNDLDHNQDLTIQELKIRFEYFLDQVTVTPTQIPPTQSP